MAAAAVSDRVARSSSSRGANRPGRGQLFASLAKPWPLRRLFRGGRCHLVAAKREDTVVTEWFNEGWPNAPHRVLRAVLERARETGWAGTVPPYRVWSALQATWRCMQEL